MIRHCYLLIFACTISSFAQSQCWQSVSAGRDHTIALKPDGTLWAWGFNGSGQLGDGTTTNKDIPTQVGKDSNWKDVFAGVNSSFAIKTDGTLWAWGSNLFGVLGDGAFSLSRSTPFRIGTSSNWKSISVGTAFTIGLKTDGTLWGWGDNSQGYLGIGSSASYVPVQLGADTNWASVSVGGFHTIAMKLDGTLWAWGSNASGELGDGTTVQKNSPKRIGTDTNWQSIGAGNDFSMATKTNGSLWTWGKNDLGQLGNGTYDNQYIPTQVGTDFNWKSISTGYDNAVAIKTGGTLWAWGSIIGSARLGINDTNNTPKQIGTSTDWQSITSGDWHSFAFRTDGTLWAWGDYLWGKLGTGNSVNSTEPQTLSTDAPKGKSTQILCPNATIRDLQVSGTVVKWYLTPTGGTELPVGTILVNGNSYYASQTKNSCESKRLQVTVALNTLPTPPPTGVSAQVFCGPSTVANIIANGTDVKWYATQSSGALLAFSTPLVNGSRYYASQMIGDCESSIRLEVAATVNITPTPTGSIEQIFCNAATIAELIVSGSSTKWYSTPTGGTSLIANTPLTSSTTYYATQTINSCESPRLSVRVQINTTTTPSGQPAQFFCNSGTIASLVAQGSLIKWYDSENGGIALNSNAVLVNGNNYYGTQTINSCEAANRLRVNVLINTAPTPTPTGSATQTVCNNSTIGNLAINGSGIKWYTNPAGGLSLLPSTQLFNNTRYHASQTINGCESTSRFEVLVLINFIPTSSPANLPNETWQAVTTGESHHVGIKEDGTLWAWGDNSYGQLGDGTNTNKSIPNIVSSELNWKSVYAGQSHTLAIKNDGTLWAWGLNNRGQLGDGTNVNKNFPIKIGSNNDWTTVAPGFSHTVAINAKGELWAWGSNEFGQLGDGTNLDKKNPTLINPGFFWKETDAGWYHTIAIRDDGTLWTWGYNFRGQLGDGTFTNRNLPTRISFVDRWKSVSGGSDHSLATRFDSDDIWVCGLNDLGQIGSVGRVFVRQLAVVGLGGLGWKSIAAGERCSFLIDKYNFLWSTGWEKSGRLGNGRNSNTGQSSFSRVINFSDLRSLSSWGDHSIAILNNGSLLFFGGGGRIASYDGQARVVEYPQTQAFCDNGSVSNLSVTGSNIKWYDVPSGGSPLLLSTELIDKKNYYATQTVNSCESTNRFVVTTIVNRDISPPPIGSSLQVVCNSGLLSDLKVLGSNIKWYENPTKSRLLPASTALANGNRYYASQTINGCESTTLLDILVSINTAQTMPPQGTALQNLCNGSTISDLTVSGSNIKWYASAASGVTLPTSSLLVNGAKYYASQTINSCESVSRLEVTVSIDPGSSVPHYNSNWQSISTRGHHNLAIKNDGTLWAWGWNYYGQVGDNALLDVNMPKQIGRSTSWKYVSAGYYHSLAIKTDGTLWAWGSNASGRLGDGTGFDRISPTQVGNANNWQTISSSWNHNLALKTDGTLFAWGENGEYKDGSLGDGTAINRLSPVQIGLSSDWNMIATGTSSSYAIKNDGTLWAWGLNDGGQLGDGTNTIRRVPTKINNETNWKFITSGGRVVLAIKTDNTLWIWGTGYNGLIGNVPVQVGVESDWKVATVSVGWHFLAIKQNGSLWGWGNNSNGQLGDGTTIQKSAPTRIGSDIDWVFTAAGENHSLGLKSDGSLRAWGWTDLGQLGDGSAKQKVIPTFPSLLSTQTFCQGATISNLVTDDPKTKWFTNPLGGTSLPAREVLANGRYYYASQADSCEAFPRTGVIAVVKNISSPTGLSNQSFCPGAIVSDLRATGSDIKWYVSPTSVVPLLGTTLLTNGNRYYASQTNNTCESQTRFEVLVTFTSTLPPVGTTIQTFCSTATISNLTVTGTNIKWYLSATGGTPLPLTFTLMNGIRYYASQTVANCESQTRLDIIVNLNNAPQPTAATSQSFCPGATVANIVASGNNLKWYASAVSGTPLAITTLLTNGARYYATQTINSCESQTRLEVVASLNNTPQPTGAASQSFCSGATVANLVASGSNLKWYASATGGAPLALTIALTNGTRYYGSQTLNSCESLSRLEVTASINSTLPPTGTSTQIFCSGSVVTNLNAVGTGIKWYTAATSGTLLVPSTLLINGQQYFASQTISNCESATRLRVTTNINPIPQVPSGSSPQSFEKGKTISDLVISGIDLKWYNSLGNATQKILPLPLTELLKNDSLYYATQTVLNCESPPSLGIKVSIITGVEPLYKTAQLEYFPNPVHENLVISAKERIETIELLNSIGQSLLFKNVGANETEIDFKEFVSGIYFVQIRVNGKYISAKIVRE